MSRCGQLIKEEEEIEITDKENLENLHLEMGHVSVKAMTYKLKNAKIYKLRNKLKYIVRKCPVCQRSGLAHVNKQITAVKTNRTNELWETDLEGPLLKSRTGFNYLLTIVDHFSKRAHVRPLRSKESKEVLNNIIKTIKVMENTEKILTDNGREFLNTLTINLANEKGIDWRFGALYSPTTTGLIERFNRTFIDKLKKNSNFGKRDWVDCIPTSIKSYMNTYHRAPGCTPNEVRDQTEDLGRHKIKNKKSSVRLRKENKSETIALGDRILYHHLNENRNKLEADYKYSGIVKELN